MQQLLVINESMSRREPQVVTAGVSTSRSENWQRVKTGVKTPQEKSGTVCCWL